MPMKSLALIVVIFAVIALFPVGASATGPIHTKLLPHSVNYPLIMPAFYSAPTGDPYRASFGVRRMLTKVTPTDYEITLLESLNWQAVYGSYGVIGRGEDVFTNRAAAWRRHHQGR